jgi:polyvinyl alcohol dehydrogenase (cytochrome)
MFRQLCSVGMTAAAVLFGVAGSALAQADAPDGPALFRKSCTVCHNGAADSRAPAPESLRQRSPEAIVTALTGGSMRLQGAHMSGGERRAIAEYLTGKKMGGDLVGASVGRCTTTPPFPDPSRSPSWNGWSPTVANTHFQPAAQAGLTAAQVPRLTLKWAFGFPDAAVAWAQPTVAGGRVFVGSQNGTVYSLDARSGCIYWTFSAQGSVRTAVTIGPRRPARTAAYLAYFADMRGFVYALDAATGEIIWSRNVEDHPMVRMTGAPTLYDGRLYVPAASFEETVAASPLYECCSFRGSLTAVDAITGEILWKTYTISEEPRSRGKSNLGVTSWSPSGGGIWTSPTIDSKRGLIYVGVGNSYTGEPQPTTDSITAIDLKTGKIRWSRQQTPKDIFVGGCRPGIANPNCPPEVGPDFDFGATPVLTRLPNGKDVLIAGQKSGVGYAMDPDKQGGIIWQYRAGEGGALGGIEWGTAADSENAYFPVSDINSKQPGGLHAVKLTTGERVWFASPLPPRCGTGRGCNAAQSAAITVIPGVVFSGSNDGALRAYSTRDGSIIWEFDTNREFKTLNGVQALGASIIGPGPTVVGGMVYVNSGYGYDGGRPGNVLLAFGIE